MTSPGPGNLRRLQVSCVAVGTLGVLASLLGGTLESRLLALGGIAVVLACLTGIFVLGLLAWRQGR